MMYEGEKFLQCKWLHSVTCLKQKRTNDKFYVCGSKIIAFRRLKTLTLEMQKIPTRTILV